MKYTKNFLTSAFLAFGFWSSIFGFGNVSAIKTENVSTSNSKQSGSELYARHCASCHGTEGRGETEKGREFDVPNIADAKWQKRHSNAKISKKIQKGGGGMPAFAKKLSQAEINSLVAYVRTLKK